jgi:hypothetical protein
VTKQKTILYLSAETATALTEFQRLHHDRFRSASAAADHLLGRALASPLNEGLELLLAPALRQVVAAAVRREVEEQFARQLGALANRLAGLLVQVGTNSGSAYGMTVTILERLLGDPARAREIAADVRLKAGAQFARGGAPPGEEAR